MLLQSILGLSTKLEALPLLVGSVLSRHLCLALIVTLVSRDGLLLIGGISTSVLFTSVLR